MPSSSRVSPSIFGSRLPACSWPRSGRRFARPKGFAFTRQVQFIQRGQVDGAQRGNFAVQAVDFAPAGPCTRTLPSVMERADGRPGRPARRSAAWCTAPAQARGLFLELEFGDALAQRVQRARAAWRARRWRAVWRSGRRICCAGRPGPFRGPSSVQRLCRPPLAAASGQAGQLVARAAAVRR